MFSPSARVFRARSIRTAASLTSVPNCWLCDMRFRLRSWWRRCTLLFFQLPRSRCLPARFSPLSGQCGFLPCGPEFPSSCRLLASRSQFPSLCRFLACCTVLFRLSRLVRCRTPDRIAPHERCIAGIQLGGPQLAVFNVCAIFFLLIAKLFQRTIAGLWQRESKLEGAVMDYSLHKSNR